MKKSNRNPVISKSEPVEDFESFSFLAVFRHKLLYRDDQFDQRK